MQVFQLVVLAVEGEGFPAPAVADDLHALFEPAHPLAHRHLEGPEVRLLVSQAHAQDDSPLGHQVQGDHVLRQVDRVVQGSRITDVPTFRVVVWAATAVATISGDGRNPSRSWWCSPKKQESKPTSSASRASAITSSIRWSSRSPRGGSAMEL